MRVFKWYFTSFTWSRSQLDHPLRVLLFCGILFSLTLLSNGLWWKIWALNRDQVRMASEMATTRTLMTDLDRKLKMTQDLNFIERQAKDRLDLVDENDLVFVFPEE